MRLHDHAPLVAALRAHAVVVPVFVLDPALLAETDFGWRKTGSARLAFMLEAVADLRASLRARGSNLVVSHAAPAQALATLAQQVGATAVYATGYATPEEQRDERRVAKALATLGATLHLSYGHPLLHPDDLPDRVTPLPEIFTQWRKEVERRLKVRQPLPAPGKLPALPASVEAGALPTLASLGYESLPRAAEADYAAEGGETAGLAHWEAYLEAEYLSTYKETRNGLLGMPFSSKLSAWLAQGCLSPRQIYWDIKRYEAEVASNESTYWLVFELLWRDYFYYVARQYGSRLFRPGGLRGHETRKLRRDRGTLEAWRTGQTGVPLVDACMRQLLATGFMSNRGRQNVASYQVHDLHQDWIYGASWFEHALVDYDPASNWANWCYVAGVGNDPRPSRKFNVVKQGYDYDPDGAFVRHYLPELKGVPNHAIHEPHRLSPLEAQALGMQFAEPLHL